MVNNPLCAVPRFPETTASSETRDKRLQRLARLSQQALVEHCDRMMADQNWQVRILSAAI